ncbi:MAG: DUF2516 family protein [Actinomycetota bacterium]|nr:DUF2516 family protein [Actinomycetota bacterium]
MGGISAAVGGVQMLVFYALAIASLGIKVFAFVDALRHRAELYPAAGKKTKNIWLLITGLALAFGVLVWGNVLSLFNVLGVVAAGVYLADVRPALRQVRGSGGGQHQGPYGPW